MYKAMKLRTAGKLISCIGLISCLVGLAAYCTLSLPEVLNLPFEWIYIIIDLAIMLVLTLVGVGLVLIANAIDRRADMVGEEVEDIDEENECAAECCATCPFAEQCDYLIADNASPAKPAPEIECDFDDEEAEARICTCNDECEEAATAIKYPAAVAKVRKKLPESVNDKMDKIVEKTVTTVKDKKKVIVAVTAATAATALVVKSKKAKKAKLQAKNRKKFYEWLG